jgi:hypothetical protein
MGWLSNFYWENVDDVKQHLRKELVGDEILAESSYGSEWYVAVKRDSEVFIAVILIKSMGENAFGYKDMDSTCIPYYFNCPESILKLNTLVDSNTLEWIERCREKRSKKLKVKAFIKSLVSGDLVNIDDKIMKYHFNDKGSPCFSIVQGDKVNTIYRYPLRSQMRWLNFSKINQSN